MASMIAAPMDVDYALGLCRDCLGIAVTKTVIKINGLRPQTDPSPTKLRVVDNPSFSELGKFTCWQCQGFHS